jgi:hypothetical protein
MSIPTPASSPRSAAPQSQSEIETEIETLSELAGEIVAGICLLIVQGLDGFKQDGRMNVDVRQQGGILVAGLLELRSAYADVLDFDHLCRHAGTCSLRERIGNSVSDKTIDRLVVDAVDIVKAIARLQSN